MKDLTLKKAKTICKDIKGLNGTAVLINEVAPMVSSTGMILNEAAQKEEQTKLNKKGLMVVTCIEHSDFKEGDRITIIPNSDPVYHTVLTSKEVLDDIPAQIKEDLKNNTGRFEDMNEANRSMYYKKYVVFVYHPIFFASKIG